MKRSAHYQHDLGNGLYLDAYSIDPKIEETGLKKIVTSKEEMSKFNLEELSRYVSFRGRINSFGELNVETFQEPYQVPEQLREYRKALEEKLVAAKKFNGPIAVVRGSFGKQLQLCQGGYFDFIATKLEAIPGDLLPDKYPAGKSIEELMPEWQIINDQRARYFGLAFAMLTNNRTEFSFVQRANGLGIAANCIATTGGTPGFKKEFFKHKFNFAEYYENEVIKEMKEEYELTRDELIVTGANLIDDAKTVPHAAVEITTSLTTYELAERVYGKTNVVKEHSILYCISPEAIPIFLKRFDIWPSVQFVMNKFYEQNCQ